MYGMSLLLSDWMHCNKKEGYRGRDYDFVLFCLALLLCFPKRANAVNHKPLKDDSLSRRGRILQTLSSGEGHLCELCMCSLIFRGLIGYLTHGVSSVLTGWGLLLFQPFLAVSFWGNSNHISAQNLHVIDLGKSQISLILQLIRNTPKVLSENLARILLYTLYILHTHTHTTYLGWGIYLLSHSICYSGNTHRFLPCVTIWISTKKKENHKIFPKYGKPP